MNLTQHFTLDELTASGTASRLNISNTAPPAIVTELTETAKLLEKIRSILNQPIIISSGYRSPALNSAIGGASNSAHLYGKAADFICPGFGNPYVVATNLTKYAATLQYDQLIVEWNQWVHIGRAISGVPRLQNLTINNNGTVYGINQ